MGTWKKAKLTSILTLFLAVAMFAYSVDYSHKSNQKFNTIQKVIDQQDKRSESKYKDLKQEIITIKKQQEDSLKKASELIQKEEDAIYQKFKSGNQKLNDKHLAKEFIRASKAFNLESYDKNLDIFISQLLHESRGYQYYPADHNKKANKLVIGTSGEIGIGQIMPRTAHFLMKYKMTTEDFDRMKKAGAEDFDKIRSQNYNDKSKQDIINWLSKRENNLAMWSFVIKYYLNLNHGNVTRGLVAYNRGQGGLNKYVKNGGNPSKYVYYQAIQKIKNRIVI